MNTISKTNINIIWIAGGIDSNGYILGHPYIDGDVIDIGNHTLEEKATGTTWRWDVRHQCFMSHIIPNKRSITEEEYVLIENWLVKRGYANLETFQTIK